MHKQKQMRHGVVLVTSEQSQSTRQLLINVLLCPRCCEQENFYHRYCIPLPGIVY